jgi:hypothetical protein
VAFLSTRLRATAIAFGGYGERVTKPEDIIPAIQRGIQKTKGRHPGAAGVHHVKGNRGFEAGDLTSTCATGHFEPLAARCEH